MWHRAPPLSAARPNQNSCGSQYSRGDVCAWSASLRYHVARSPGAGPPGLLPCSSRSLRRGEGLRRPDRGD
eukprot:8411951-Alexandrium_andersonii.AAC.1